MRLALLTAVGTMALTLTACDSNPVSPQADAPQPSSSEARPGVTADARPTSEAPELDEPIRDDPPQFDGAEPLANWQSGSLDVTALSYSNVRMASFTRIAVDVTFTAQASGVQNADVLGTVGGGFNSLYYYTYNTGSSHYPVWNANLYKNGPSGTICDLPCGGDYTDGFGYGGGTKTSTFTVEYPRGSSRTAKLFAVGINYAPQGTHPRLAEPATFADNRSVGLPAYVYNSLSAPTVTSSSSTPAYGGGEDISISWANVSGNCGYWIGNYNDVMYQELGQNETSIVFNEPNPQGFYEYEMRTVGCDGSISADVENVFVF